MEQIILTIWQTSGTGTQETCTVLYKFFLDMIEGLEYDDLEAQFFTLL
jgi:hypothetical protein